MSRLTTFFVRITSPDVPRESRHVWKLSVDGSQSCRLSNDTGVRYPRWGASGYILYLQEADTNHDGRIDFRDDFLIRVVHQQGGVAKTVGQSRSAVWSPDGKYVAFVQKSKVYIVGVTGEAPPRGTVLRGEIIATNSRNPEAARDFWAIDPQSGAETALPSDPAKKYLWLGQLAPSGSQIVFTNTMKTTLETREVENNISRVVDRGDFHFMDPAWSPDEKQIVYVSDRPTDQHPCWDF
jgi:Tol biopolymer transport system component